MLMGGYHACKRWSTGGGRHANAPAGGVFMFTHLGLRNGLLSMVLAGATGCSGSLDGTWVFQWDQENIKEISTYQTDDESNSTEGPACVESGDYPVRELGGTRYSFVEIYLTQGTGIVVSMDGQELVGSVNGSSFDVEASFKEVDWSSDDEYEQVEWLMTLEGTMAAGEIDGQLDLKSITAVGFPTVECLYQSRLDYNAVKLTTESKPDRGLGTEGAGVTF
jgi:hypothetical protein